jgi:hypothetical protein
MATVLLCLFPVTNSNGSINVFLIRLRHITLRTVGGLLDILKLFSSAPLLLCKRIRLNPTSYPSRLDPKHLAAASRGLSKTSSPLCTDHRPAF